MFKVKKAKKSAETEKKESLFSKRVLELNLSVGQVMYLREIGSSGYIFPSADVIARVSIVLENDCAVDFFFEPVWKNKSQLRLFFKTVRERDVFLDVYFAIPTTDPLLVDHGRTRTGSRLQRLPAEKVLGLSELVDVGTSVSVFCATWNMGNEPAPQDLSAWIKPGYDIYAIGAQETNLSRKQEGEEVRLQKQQDDASRGEVLLEKFADANTMELMNAAGEQSRRTSAKAMRKKVEKVIQAATEQELLDKKKEMLRLMREYEKLSRDAKTALKEAKKDKSKLEAAEELQTSAAAAKKAYMECKTSRHNRKRELSQLVKRIDIDHAASVMAGEKIKKKDMHFVSRVRAHMTKDGHDFAEIAYTSLWGLKLVVFIRRSLLKQVSCVETDSVPCGGPGGNYGNKGGVAVSFMLGSTSFCFICAHLAAHLEKVKLRNQNFHRIMQDLSLGVKEWPTIVKFDHLFFFGDLNYRIEATEDQVLKCVREGSFHELIEKDQLQMARKLESAFAGFDEEEPNFMPTFKLLKGGPSAAPTSGEAEFPHVVIQSPINPADHVAYYLERVPAYCDRILVRSSKGCKQRIKCLRYDASFALATSDHAPVSAVFSCGVDWKSRLLDVSSFSASGNPPSYGTCFILMRNLVARLKSEQPDVSGQDLFEQSCGLTITGPGFLASSLYDALIPAKEWGTAVEPRFLGSLSLECRHAYEETLRAQRIYIRVVSNRYSIRGYGSLKLETAFSSLRGQGGIPFEVDLYNHASGVAVQQVGILSGIIMTQSFE